MAVVTQTGIVGHKAVMAQLAVDLAANGWTVNENNTPAGVEDVHELFVEAPGWDPTRKVYVQIRTFTDVGNGFYGFETKGAIAYDSGLTFDSQAGVNPLGVFTLMWENAIDYWLYINDRNFKVVFKVSGTYRTLYAGFALPYALPSEWPFPLYVASDWYEEEIYTINSAQARCFADPGRDCAYLRVPTGWVNVYNHNPGAIDAYVQSPAVDRYHCYPYYSGGSTSGGLSRIEWQFDELNRDARFAMPVEIMGSVENQNILLMEDVFFIPGFGSAAEATFTFDSDTYRIFPNIDRNDANHYFCIREV